MPDLLLVVADLVAITLLVHASYFPKHRRPDMVVAYIGLNVGVLAVASVLTGSPVSIGLGMGLFGVLSLIRLRSTELSHEEVAYYFASLALGLIFGLAPEPRWLAPAMGALIVLTLAVVDHVPVRPTARRQVVTLDRVITDEGVLRAHLASLLGAEVTALTIERTDLVRDCMTVDVRYRLLDRPAAHDAGPTGGAIRPTAVPDDVAALAPGASPALPPALAERVRA